MTVTKNEVLSLPLKVRDYECDTGGGVNNAVYLNYLEFGRFEFLRQILKWDLPALAAQNVGFVVARIEIDFQRSLVPGDEFVLETVMDRASKRRFLFTQNIYRASDRKVILNAKVLCTAINILTGQSETPDVLENLLSERYPVPVEEKSPKQSCHTIKTCLQD